ncbi:Transcription termination factor Rho [Pseudoclavibacter triregionum]|nr:Transcription termination factor Rho [Pseudoclavibacter triregionum]
MNDMNGADRADTTAPELASMRVADLQALAAELGIRGAARLRKGELVAAIEAARAEAQDAPADAAAQDEAPAEKAPAEQAEVAAAEHPADEQPADEQAPEAAAEQAAEASASQEEELRFSRQPVQGEARQRRARGRRVTADPAAGPAEQPAEALELELPAPAEAPEVEASQAGADEPSLPMSLDDLVLPAPRGEDDAEGDDKGAESEGRRGRKRSRGRGRRNRGDRAEGEQDPQDDAQDQSDDSDDADEEQGGSRRSRRGRGRGQNGQNGQGQQQNGNGGQQGAQQDDDEDDDESDEGRRGRGRYRDRKRRQSDDVDPEIAPDDVLLPIAGILDVLENYAFVRTSGYLPGQNDVYVSLGQVKKYGLRKGDAIVGAIRQPREGEQHHGRQKYNAIVKFDTINGQTPEESAGRPEFDELTPLYPRERLQLETPGGHVAQRLIDLFAPVGKGSRGLIVAPPKSGKSVVLERIANAVAENSPETHLMLVLVDERPEELTRMQRTIRGEVVAATFDLPAEDQTTIAELAIERAKRLVELDLDVVVLLDSVTQLCRAYNLTAPASGRILAGGVDASALYPPKRFFGAARNVENGGSLTILATAMVETGSRTDEVILEEFAGTENLEIRLSKEIADRRIFPALDMNGSSTLMEETLLSPEEVEATWSVRRALAGSDPRAILESVLHRLGETATNAEFVESVRSRPIEADAGFQAATTSRTAR